MKGFIKVFDVEFNLAKRINVDHIVDYYPNNSGTGNGQILLSTGKQVNTQETPEAIDDMLAKLEAVEMLPCVSGPSAEEIAASITQSIKTLPDIIKKMEETSPRKNKKGKEKETSPLAPDYRDV